MALPKDPETLRIPAFMRKRSINSRLKKPLLLTALDRKKAGVLPEGLQKKKRVARKALWRPAPRRERSAAVPMEMVLPFDGEVKTPVRKRVRLQTSRTSRRKTTPRAIHASPTFEAPFISTATPASPAFIGTVTHYYSKIKVAVIKLADTLSVGDCITYSTPTGMYEQVVESIEIDHVPVFSAHKGQEIGIKLKKEPRLDSPVMK